MYIMAGSVTSDPSKFIEIPEVSLYNLFQELADSSLAMRMRFIIQQIGLGFPLKCGQ
jgi:hypothetical protein